MIICAPWPRISRALRRKRLASCGSKLPMVEPGKKPTFGMLGDRGGQREGRGEIGRDRIDRKVGEILPQRVGLRMQEIA